MPDYFEIDFFNIHSKKSGDAISIRYQINEETYIHVVDGGFQDDGQRFVEFINQYYSNPDYIDHVIVTHSDGDHCSGIKDILENFDIGTLWMMRPWIYAAEIIDKFSRFTSIENLEKRLREIYSSIATLEEIALKKQIPIKEPLQGSEIGYFTVLAPTKSRYLDLIVESDKTPESISENINSFSTTFAKILKKATNLIRSLWGKEIFSEEETSNENEMSVIQYSKLCDTKILLTGDAGRSALTEAAEFAPNVNLFLPVIDRLQIPHHVSRRDVYSELLNIWLGPKLDEKPTEGEENFQAYVCASKDDKDHPRKAVIRAIIHRGGKVYDNKNATLRTSKNAPEREGWHAATHLLYPEEQEE